VSTGQRVKYRPKLSSEVGLTDRHSLWIRVVPSTRVLEQLDSENGVESSHRTFTLLL